MDNSAEVYCLGTPCIKQLDVYCDLPGTSFQPLQHLALFDRLILTHRQTEGEIYSCEIKINYYAIMDLRSLKVSGVSNMKMDSVHSE